MTSFYYRPIIPLTLALIAGIMIGNVCPDHRLMAWWVAAGGALLLIFLIFRKKTAAVLPLILFSALGYLLIQPWVAPRFPSGHIRFSATGDKSLVTGVIETSPVISGFRQSFIIKVEALGGSASRKKATGKLRVSLSGRDPFLNVCDRIKFVGRIQPIRSFYNPGGFDYNRYLAFKGVWASASGQGESVTVLDRSVPTGLEAWISPARKSVASLIDAVASTDAAGIMKALLLGDRGSVTDALREDFQRTGVGHLLAISGLHVGLVAGVVFFIFMRLFGYIPELLRRAWLKRAAAVPAFVAVLGYGMLAGMSPSTQRAVMMVSVFLAAFFVGRPQDTLNSVAAAALVILILQPPALFAISFQLSFAAVVTIVLGLSLAPKPDMSIQQGMGAAILRRMVAFMQVSLAAILGTLPLVLYYFNETSLIGLLSNLIFVPIIGFGVVPLGLISVCLYPVNASVAAVGLKLCSSILTPALSGVQAAADLPFAAIKTVTPSVVEIVLYYCLLAAAGMMMHVHITGRRDTPVPAPGSRQGVFRLAVALSILSVVGFALDGLYWGYQRFWSDKLRVSIIDVGHGNATLVEIPGGEVLLIDGGGFSDNSVYDVGQRIVAPLLWRKKIRTVRTLILSHPDSDHVNGLIYIAGHFHVERIISNGEPAGSRGFAELMSMVRDRGIRMPVFDGLPRAWSTDGVDIDLLYPLPGYRKRGGMAPWGDANNNSLVVKVTLKEVSFLLPGDIMAAAEKELVAAAGDRLGSRILLAPHHGSRSSSTLRFLETVTPEIVVVSSGWNEQYGASSPEVIARYEGLGARILTTPEHGAVVFTTDGDQVWVETTVR